MGRVLEPLEPRWESSREALLRIGIWIMVPVAIGWLGYELWRFFSDANPVLSSPLQGAVDLSLRQKETRWWFGFDLDRSRLLVYPPASYLLLAPLVAWPSFLVVRILWLATTLAATGWLISLLVRGSRADTPLERRFIALVPLAAYATGATVGNGQLTLQLLPLMIGGLLLAARATTWREDLLAAGLILLALIKPNLTAPFFWIAVFVPGRLRPAALVVAGYVALTVVALVLAHDPTPFGTYLALTESSGRWGQAFRIWDLAIVLTRLGFREWLPHASIVIVLGLGAWTYRHRNRDLWILMSVAAVVTRFLTYHRWYDDLLLVVPLVTLFRLAHDGQATARQRTRAFALFGWTWLSLLAPGGHYVLPRLVVPAYLLAQTILWLGVLTFLLVVAEKHAARDTP